MLPEPLPDVAKRIEDFTKLHAELEQQITQLKRRGLEDFEKRLNSFDGPELKSSVKAMADTLHALSKEKTKETRVAALHQYYLADRYTTAMVAGGFEKSSRSRWGS